MRWFESSYPSFDRLCEAGLFYTCQSFLAGRNILSVVTCLQLCSRAKLVEKAGAEQMKIKERFTETVERVYDVLKKDYVVTIKKSGSKVSKVRATKQTIKWHSKN